MRSDKDTVFITISVGMIARNLLHNRFWDNLTRDYNVVVMTPLHEDEAFKEEFGREGVTFEPLVRSKLTRGELILKGFHKSLIYNQSVKIRSFYGLTLREKKTHSKWKKIKGWLELIVFGWFLSKITPLRDLVKIIDRAIYTREFYTELFDKYKPTAVFVTNISSDDEIQVIRSARKRDVLTFGMTKSWDNFSKIGFREKVKHLIVWSQFMCDEAMAFQNYKRDEIVITGIPQFDLYNQMKGNTSREDFLNLYGLDPSKKVILFGQEAPHASPDDPYIVEILRDWIKENNLSYQVLIRPHFGHAGSIECFDGLPDGETVFIDKNHKPSGFKKGAWDYSTEHHQRLALSMRYSDMVITSTSTLVLDAMAADNYVVCYAFDKDKNLAFEDSPQRWYETLWFEDLRKSGLEKFLLKSEEELIENVGNALASEVKPHPPEFDVLIDRFCHKADGNSGERIYTVIKEEIDAIKI